MNDESEGPESVKYRTTKCYIKVWYNLNKLSNHGWQNRATPLVKLKLLNIEKTSETHEYLRPGLWKAQKMSSKTT